MGLHSHWNKGFDLRLPHPLLTNPPDSKTLSRLGAKFKIWTNILGFLVVWRHGERYRGWWYWSSKAAKTSHRNFAYLPSTWWLHVIQLVIGVGQCHHQSAKTMILQVGFEFNYPTVMPCIVSPSAKFQSLWVVCIQLIVSRHPTHQSKNDMYIDIRYFKNIDI